MVRLAYLTVLPVLTLSLAACAPTSGTSTDTSQSANARRCILQSQVQTFSLKNDVVYLHGPGKSVFELETTSFCPELDTTLQMVVKPERGSSQVCVGDWISLIAVNNPMSPAPCRVRVVKSLTQADITAMPEKDRP